MMHSVVFKKLSSRIRRRGTPKNPAEDTSVINVKRGLARLGMFFFLLLVVMSVAAQDLVTPDLVVSHQAFANRIALLDAAVVVAYQQADIPAVAAALEFFLAGAEGEPGLAELIAAMKASTSGRSLETLTEGEAEAVEAARQGAVVFGNLHRRIEWCIGSQAVLDAWMAIIRALGGQ